MEGGGKEREGGDVGGRKEDRRWERWGRKLKREEGGDGRTG